MTQDQQYFELMLKIIKRSGEIAKEFILNSSPSLKADMSVVTMADRSISNYAQQELSQLLSTGNHLLIDEENPNHLTYLDEAVLAKYPFIWSLDPIDGTRPYANTMPFFGVSLGLLKDRRPWMGAVYFPVLDELFTCDGEKAYFITHPFTPQEVRREIVPVDQEITSQSIFLCSDAFYKFYQWESKDCHIIVPACAVVDLCWPAIGRGCGGMFRAHIWDFAGSWPILHKAGLKIRSIKSGTVLDKLDLDFFDREKRPWKVKEFYIVSSERNFPVLRDKLKPISR